MLFRFCFATILASDSVVSAQQSYLQARQAPRRNGQDSTHNSAESVRSKVKPRSRFLQLTSNNCTETVTTDGTTVTTCTEVKSGRHIYYVIHQDNNLCYLVDGIPCWTSYLCVGSQNAFIDCRNLMLNQVDDCLSIDCDGNCLPDLDQLPSFANGKNGCKEIGFGCASFGASGFSFDECTYLDVLGDGKFVAVKYEGTEAVPVSCWAEIDGSSCICNADCEVFSAQISYDCSNLSSGPCAVTTCGKCADRTHSTPTTPPSPSTTTTTPNTPLSSNPTTMGPTPTSDAHHLTLRGSTLINVLTLTSLVMGNL